MPAMQRGCSVSISGLNHNGRTLYRRRLSSVGSVVIWRKLHGRRQDFLTAQSLRFYFAGRQQLQAFGMEMDIDDHRREWRMLPVARPYVVVDV